MFLLIGGASLVMAARDAHPKNGFPAFWQEFRSAVISSDKKTVAALSRFPIGVSLPASNIKNRSELRQRFREVFVDPINASQCFAQTEPSPDTENPELFTIACRYKGGSDAAAYQFEHTKSGWKFTHFQLSTTCRCR
jgi:hypothetical protein